MLNPPCSEKEVFVIKIQIIQKFTQALKKLKASSLLILAGISLIAASILSFYPHSIFTTNPAKKNSGFKKIILVSPAKEISVSPVSQITGKGNVSITTFVTKPPVINTSPASSQVATLQPSPSQVITTPTSAVTQAQKQTVNIQIIEPDGTSNFSVTLNPGNSLCDNLTEAKAEEKIKSVTLDYSYMTTFHSAYVREMNGYTNNWTMTVNGKSPQGCSLYNPNSGDNIVWKFD